MTYKQRFDDLKDRIQGMDVDWKNDNGTLGREIAWNDVLFEVVWERDGWFSIRYDGVDITKFYDGSFTVEIKEAPLHRNELVNLDAWFSALESAVSDVAKSQDTEPAE